MAKATKRVFDAYVDDDGNVCYMVENDPSVYACVYVVPSEFFRFVPTTPHMGRLEIYHIAFPGVLLVSFTMEHDHEDFMADLAQQVAFYVENYC